jgi:triacylglycerol lipase
MSQQSPYSWKKGYKHDLTRHKPRIEYKPKPKPMLSDFKFPNKFDLDRAIELMQLSIFAYDQFEYFNSKGNVDNWSFNNNAGYASYSIERTLNTYEKIDNKVTTKEIPIGFIAKKDNLSPIPDIYICWRGTVTGSEWVSDGDFKKTTCSFLKNGEKVHEGFQNVYTLGYDQLGDSRPSPQKVVLAYLDSINTINTTTPNYNLFVTGHSLGGALAVLNICDIVVNDYNKNAKMYNFAGPRVGDSAFANTFKNHIGTNCCNTNNALNNCCSWRVVNTNDKVPKLPLEDVLGIKLYSHVNGCSGVSVCNNANSNDNSLNGLFQITFANSLDVAAAHSSDTYLSTLKKLKPI